MANMFRPFDIQFQPFIKEIDEKEAVIQKYADAATMKRIRGIILHILLDNSTDSNASIQTSKAAFKRLHHK